MNLTESDHIWFIEQIDAYITGGLGGDELARFQAHAAACMPCEARLGAAARADQAMQSLFADDRPAAGLDDRVIAGVRHGWSKRRRLVLHPMVKRAARVTAAALLLAAIGYTGKVMLEGGSLSRFNPGRVFAKSPAEAFALHGPLRETRRAPGEAVEAYRRGQKEFRDGKLAAAHNDFQFARDHGFKPGLFQDGPEKYLARIDQKASAELIDSSSSMAVADGPIGQERAISIGGSGVEIDGQVRASLDRRVPEIDFKGNSLTDVVDFLRDVSGAKIDVNWRELENAGIDKEAPVNLKVRDEKFNSVLAQVLTSAGQNKARLGYSIDDGVIHVSTADKLQISFAVNNLMKNAQQNIRDAKYKEALGTIDSILAVDPGNDYARGVRPLVNDKYALSTQRQNRREFDDQMEKSLASAEEKRIAYDDIMRYPANWPDVSEVRDATVRQEREIVEGKEATLGDQMAASLKQRVDPDGVRNLRWPEARSTVLVPAGGTLQLGGQTIKGNIDPVVDGPVVLASPPAPPLIIQKESEQKQFPILSTKANPTGGDVALKPNDTLQISLTDVTPGAETVKSVIVNGRGNITLPLVGEVSALGRTEQQLQADIAHKYQEAGIVKNAQVSVSVLQPPPVSLTKSGSGTLVLNGGSANGVLMLNGENTYDGTTNVSGGTLTVSAAANNKLPALNFTGGLGLQGGRSSAADYSYHDSVTVPKLPEAKHEKLSEVAAAQGIATHGPFVGKTNDNIYQQSTEGVPPAADPALGRASGDISGKALANNIVDWKDNQAKDAKEVAGAGTPTSYELHNLVTNVPDFTNPPDLSLNGTNGSSATNARGFKSPEATVDMQFGSDGRLIHGKRGEARKPVVAMGDLTYGDFALADTKPATDGSKPSGPVAPVAPPVATPPTATVPPVAPPVTPPHVAPPTVAPVTPPPVGVLEPVAPSLAPIQRKIIRNGEVIFEVDSFDSSLMQIMKIVAEEAGYVSTTDSEKLPNGKVKGTVSVRLPPERLDVFVLKLRGLGDLKNQRIAAQDVTKQFVDLESSLRANRAMETALLDLIKNGKGQVKDLVAAEKELGNYREKIEQTEGELRYLGSQVAMSTLNITLFERDIKTPTAAFETETVDTALETEDVEKSRIDAMKAIEDAKGRIVESQMKRFEAGQLQATIMAEVAPENAGPVVDRLKQLGRVARMDVERKQTTSGGQGAPVGLKLDRRPTVFKISIYNLANIAPRETVNVSLACEDVEKAYHTIMSAAELTEQVNGVPVQVGRVVSSSLNSQRSDQVSGTISIEVRADKAAAVEAAIRSAGGTGGEVMHLTVTENPDANNVTRSKRGYSVTLASLASVAPRETAVISVAAKDVAQLYQTLMKQLENKEGKPSGHVFASRLEEQDRLNVEGFVDFEIPRSEIANLDALLNGGLTSEIFRRNVSRSTDITNTMDTKVRWQVSLINVGRLKPVKTQTLVIEVNDPEQALLDVQGVATASGARIFEPRLDKDEAGKVGTVVFDVPLSAAGQTADQLVKLGAVQKNDTVPNESVPLGALAKARFDVKLVPVKQLVAANHGAAARIREGLGTSIDALLLVLEWIIVVAPFLLVGWIVWKLFRRGRKAKPAAVVAGTT